MSHVEFAPWHGELSIGRGEIGVRDQEEDRRQKCTRNAKVKTDF
jgi:hypothetical protein